MLSFAQLIHKLLTSSKTHKHNILCLTPPLTTLYSIRTVIYAHIDVLITNDAK